MKLIDVIKERKFIDTDVYDNTFDESVTFYMGIDDEIEDSVDKLKLYLAENVDVCKDESDLQNEKIICDWYGFVVKNKEALAKFMEKYFGTVCKNEDDFIYYWIKEFQILLSGFIKEEICKELVEVLMVCRN